MIKSAKNFYCISSRIEKTGQLYGCFKIGPFDGHQSLTFANALRRTLLADQSRCVFDTIQISGIEHEYSNLIGVRESVVDIILNLEKCIFQTVQPITKPQVAFLNSCGPGILRAQHLHLPKGFKCVDPSQYIATLEVDGRLTLKLFFSPNWKEFLPLLRQKQSVKFPEAASQSQSRPRWSRSLTGSKRLLERKRKNLTNFDLQRKRTLSRFDTRNPLKKQKRLNSSLQKQTFQFLKKSKQPSFQKQENFLFLKSSRCPIERVNYTLQSQISGFSSALFPTSQASRQQRNDIKIEGYFEKPLLCNQEFLLFEVWTDGSCHPQVVILQAINEILLEFFPYSLEIATLGLRDRSIKRHQDFNKKQKSLMNRSSLKEEQNFCEKFLNLEIGNFYFDLETYIFLKKKSISRVIDFLNFFENNSIPQQFEETIQNFQKFIFTQLKRDGFA